MGTTIDIIPLLPEESPEDAIARIYDGGVQIRFHCDDGPTIEEIDSGVASAPAGAFDEWRAEVLRRLWALFPDWMTEDEHGTVDLWTAGYMWQIEMHSDNITLRLRWSVDRSAPGPNDHQLFAVFEGLDTIIHWPDDDGRWVHLDFREHWPDSLW